MNEQEPKEPTVPRSNPPFEGVSFAGQPKEPTLVKRIQVRLPKESTVPCSNPPLTGLFANQTKDMSMEGILGSLGSSSSQNSFPTVGSFVCSAKDNINKGGLLRETAGSLVGSSDCSAKDNIKKGGLLRETVGSLKRSLVEKQDECTKKVVHLDKSSSPTSKHKHNPDILRKRAATWRFDAQWYDPVQQMALVRALVQCHGVPFDVVSTCLVQDMKQKLQGYKYQDEAHRKYVFSPTDFIDVLFVLQAMDACALHCRFCHGFMQVMYRHVRDPQQWTVDRIDNNQGHTRTNVQLACLQCNVHRRTRNDTLYARIKQTRFHKTT